MNILLICDISGYVIIYYDVENTIINDIFISQNLDIASISRFIANNSHETIYINSTFHKSFKKYFPNIATKPIPQFDYETHIQDFFFKLGLGEIKLLKQFDISFNYNEISIISLALASFVKVTTKPAWLKARF